MFVSYKPDHGWQGQLHNQTAYGLLEEGYVVERVPLSKLNSEKKINEIRDKTLRDRLIAFVGDAVGGELEKRVLAFGNEHKIRHLRITRKLKTIPIYSRTNTEKPYKGYDPNSNYCIEIFREEGGGWESDVISTFDAYQIAKNRQGLLQNSDVGRKGNPLVMRLCKDDMVIMEEEGTHKIYRVVKMSANGTISFSEHQEANVDARDRTGELPYIRKMANPLCKVKARRVFVDPLGFVRDPGFRP